MTGLRAEVLGPVRLPDASGESVEVPGAIARRLVVALALAGPAGRSSAALADEVWPDDPPRNPRAALQMMVSRLRATTPQGLLESTAAGYRLAASDLSAAGGVCDDLAGLDEALALWHGTPGDDIDEPELAAALVARAAGLRLALLLQRGELLLASGRPSDAARDAAEAAGLVPLGAAEPVALRMRALAQAGRTEEALAVFAAHRTELRDALGADPSPVLVDLHVGLLRGSGPGRAAERRGVRSATTALLGRDDDLRHLADLVHSGRLTTVLGAGGLGKTRLVMELARSVTGFDRVVVVELAGVADPSDLVAVMAAAVGDRTTPRARLADAAARPPQDARTRLVDALAEAPTLLVLDNCEHLIDAVAVETASLHSDLPGLDFVTTSRTPLAVAGERVLALAPLSPEGSAAELFRERAEAARPGVHLNAAASARICDRLDGLPLAIELAAARMRTMSQADLERRLDDRFAVLVGGDRSAPERHRTLLSVIDWSWRLLGPAEQRALRRLAWFPDGFTAEAAGVALGEEAGAVLEELALQSLLVVGEPASGRTRFRMLETIREFGLLQSVEAGDAADAQRGVDAWVAHFCTPLVIDLALTMRAAGVDVVGEEMETLLSALRRPVAEREEVVVLAFAVLGILWSLRDRHDTLVEHGPALLEAWRSASPRSEPALTAAVAGATLLTITASFTRLPMAVRAAGVLRATLERIPADDRRFWTAIGRFADTALAGGPAMAALDAMTRSADPLTAATALCLRGAFLENSGDPHTALRDSEAALVIAEAHDLEWLRVFAISSIAQISVQVGDAGRARAAAQQAMALSQRVGGDERQMRVVVAASLLVSGAIDEAEEAYQSLLRDTEPDESGAAADERQIALAGYADVATARGDAVEAARRWAAAVSASQPHVPAMPWLQLTMAGAVASATSPAADPAMAAQTRRLAQELRVKLVVTARTRAPMVDIPVLGAGVLGYASWLAWPQGGDDPVGAATLAGFARALHARRDLTVLRTTSDRLRAFDPAGFDAAAASTSQDAKEAALRMLRRTAARTG